MGYTPVKTVTTGMPWTAKDMNTYVRDNMAAGVPDLFTTKGDIAAASGLDAAVRVPVGEDTAILWADDGQPGGVGWGVPGNFRATGDGGNTSANYDEYTKFDAMSSETFDPAAAYAADTWVAPHASYYFVWAHINQANTGATPPTDTYYQILLYKNGALFSLIAENRAQLQLPTGDYSHPLSGGDIVYCGKGDTLELYVYFHPTATLTWQYFPGDANRAQFCIVPLV